MKEEGREKGQTAIHYKVSEVWALQLLPHFQINMGMCYCGLNCVFFQNSYIGVLTPSTPNLI